MTSTTILRFQRKYLPVGRCIYCGKQEIELGDEHIVPYSLGGLQIPPQSSCRSCEKITGRLEAEFARATVGNYRLRMKFPTRKPKLRPRSVQIRSIGHSDERTDVSIAVDDLPRVLGVPHLPTAGYLRDKETDRNIRFWMKAPTIDLERIVQLTGGKGFYAAKFHVPQFCRMLAKIAHSFAVAKFGYEALSKHKMFLPDLILNEKSLDELTSYIGGVMPELGTIPAKRDKLYASYLRYGYVAINDGPWAIVVQLQLFAWENPPEFQIVVAELLPPTESLAERET